MQKAEKAKYLLPCPCGQKISVDVSQAGERTKCACGKELDIPTMRNIVRLERSESALVSTAPVNAWGVRHRLLLLGGTISILGLALLVYFFATNRPMRVEMDYLTPRLTLNVWYVVREGIDSQTTMGEARYEAELAAYQHRMILSSLVLVAGVLILAASFVADKFPGTRPGPKKAPAPN